ncbi:hypothetical protein FYZ48_25985 [Gimesia chilikensis]|uniref:hypothetical protein n=1 Tax=Gimesia chilikensis TaxID=2605989 RepID=UPI0011ECF6D0|nr:hypothetical protein [Gimesia chilikensis]KAA0131590.1 hypothetical protein FYZ48_25985 [Gimesia chilikensis]
MSNDLGELDLEDAAKDAAGNWQRWDSFAWFGASDRERPEDWFIYYGHHRESGLLDRSNSVQISKALKPFIDADADDSDVIEEDHTHWAVGWIKGWSVRVYRDGEITEAFKVLHGLLERMAIYPILCEHHYSEMEFDATWENIPLAAIGIKDDYELPEDWAEHVYQWLSDNRCNALENVDDQGGWPDESDLRAAFDALGYQEIEAVC